MQSIAQSAISLFTDWHEIVNNVDNILKVSLVVQFPNKQLDTTLAKVWSRHRHVWLAESQLDAGNDAIRHKDWNILR